MGRGEGGGHEGGVGSLLPLLNLISAINGHAWLISLLSKRGWVCKGREVWVKYVIAWKYLGQEAVDFGFR